MPGLVAAHEAAAVARRRSRGDSWRIVLLGDTASGGERVVARGVSVAFTAVSRLESPWQLLCMFGLVPPSSFASGVGLVGAVAPLLRVPLWHAPFLRRANTVRSQVGGLTTRLRRALGSGCPPLQCARPRGKVGGVKSCGPHLRVQHGSGIVYLGHDLSSFTVRRIPVTFVIIGGGKKQKLLLGSQARWTALPVSPGTSVRRSWAPAASASLVRDTGRGGREGSCAC